MSKRIHKLSIRHQIHPNVPDDLLADFDRIVTCHFPTRTAAIIHCLKLGLKEYVAGNKLRAEALLAEKRLAEEAYKE